MKKNLTFWLLIILLFLVLGVFGFNLYNYGVSPFNLILYGTVLPLFIFFLYKRSTREKKLTNIKEETIGQKRFKETSNRLAFSFVIFLGLSIFTNVIVGSTGDLDNETHNVLIFIFYIPTIIIPIYYYFKKTP